MLKELQEGYEKIHDTNAPWKSLPEEQRFFESYINDFFSPEKEATRVHEFYDRAKDKENLKLECVDFATAQKVYGEYSEGMQKFVKEVCAYTIDNNTVALEACEEQLSSALNSDHAFIDTLGGGKFAPKKERTIAEAADVLPDMIFFRSHMTDQLNVCEKMMEGTDMGTDTMRTKSIGLLCESVSYYWYNTLRLMTEAFNDLYESVSKREEPSTPAFVLV